MSSITRLSIGVLVAVLALGASFVVLHQPATATEQKIVTTLYPGANLVGWVSANVSAERAFEAIPELQSIRSSSEGSNWLVRRPEGEAPSSGRSLRMGRGYWFHVESDRPILWERTISEQAAQHQLRPGRHIVAWAGVDGVPLHNAMLALDREATRAWQWDARLQRFNVWTASRRTITYLPAPSPFQAARTAAAGHRPSYGLTPGDAVGVTLTRSMSWVQPTGAMPTIRFLGDADEVARAAVFEDTRFVLKHFARRFGMEVDPERLEIVVPKTWAEEYGEDESNWPKAAGFARRPPVSQPWRKSQIHIPQNYWIWNYPAASFGVPRPGRGTLLHEYFHALQFQLALPNFWPVPDWIVEGTAFAVGREFGNRKGTPIEALRYFNAITLADDVDSNYVHGIGSIAINRLVQSGSANLYFHFWQELGAQPRSADAWRRAFSSVFGRSVDEFYDEFEAWVRNHYPVVTGTLETPNNAPLAQLEIFAEFKDKSESAGIVSTDGRFQLIVPAVGQFRLRIAWPDSTCAAFVTEDGSVGNWFQAAQFSAESAELPIPLQPDFCAYLMRGALSGTNLEETNGVHIKACEVDRSLCVQSTTSSDGEFTFRVPVPGSYLLTLKSTHKKQCVTYYRDGGTTNSYEEATQIAVSDPGVQQVNVDIGPSLCTNFLNGRLVGLADRSDLLEETEDGATRMRLTIQLCPYGGGLCTDVEMDGEGRFSTGLGRTGLQEMVLFADPNTGRGLGHGEVCKQQYPGYIRIDEVEGTSVEWNVPPEFCRWAVLGVLQAEDGRPIDGRRLIVCQAGNWQQQYLCPAEVRTAQDGSFALRLPSNADYVLVPFQVFECPHEGTRESFREFGRSFSISGADVDLGTWRAPALVCK